MEPTKPNSPINPSQPVSNSLQTHNSLMPIIVGGVVLIVLVGTGAYYLGTQRNSSVSVNNQMPVVTSPTITQLPTSITNNTPTTIPTITHEITNMKSHTVNDANLTFSAPSDMEVTYETQKIIGTYKTTGLTLFVQKGNPGKSDYYQLYGIYQWDMKYSMETLQTYKEELEPSSIKEISSTGYPMLEGQIKGDRNRYVTYILAPKGMFSLYTAEPTPENKQITDKIIETFTFAR